MTGNIAKQLLLLFLLPAGIAATAQATRMYKHAVFFKDKDTVAYHVSNPSTFLSAKAIARKEARHVKIDWRDLPVNPAYLQPIADSNFIVHNTSRWFNCAIVFSEQKNAASQLAKFKGVLNVVEVGYSPVKKNKAQEVNLDEMVDVLEQKFVRTRSRKKNDSLTNIYGSGLAQAAMLNVPALHAQGLDGSGTLVAVIDAGFSKANTHKVFAHTLKNVVATYDFVDLEKNVFNDDDHGTGVWSCLGANDSFNFIGTAPQAGYVLLRSEDAGTEFPVEEFYWAIAAEYADSIGADIISSSLGYNEFGDHQYDYTQKQLNGKTAWITRAAVIASQKGMLVINSGGNEGDNDWKQITFPADADEVITVGAIDKDGNFAPFSSIGPTSDKRIKPDLVALGEGTAIASELGNVHTGNGTSYSCPVLAGGVACLWPDLKLHSQAEIKEWLQLAASNYYRPDKYFGYGVPDLMLVRAFARLHHADTLLQVNLLSDQCFHVALFSGEKQKVKFTIKDPAGNAIKTQSVQLKQKGNARIKLNPLKKAAPGTYTLVVEFPKTSFTQPVEVK